MGLGRVNYKTMRPLHLQDAGLLVYRLPDIHVRIQGATIITRVPSL